MGPVSGVWLEVVAGPGETERIHVGEELLLGREGPSEGRLGGDPELSRRHATLKPFGDSGERVLVEDLGSSNGTFVNGEQIGAPTVAGVGDTIGVGESVLRVAGAARPTAGAARPAAGVHTVPETLFGTLVARTPVPSDWIIQAVLRAIPIVIAVNFVLRTILVEYFDVPPDIPPMEPHILLGLSIFPPIGSSLFFWIDFGRRPRNRSILIYLVPSVGFSCITCAVELLALPGGSGTPEYVATILVALVAPSVVMPTMIGLRTRARLRTEAELKRNQEEANERSV